MFSHGSVVGELLASLKEKRSTLLQDQATRNGESRAPRVA
jgi:hypothetical protein